jgi:hypothetical protein
MTAQALFGSAGIRGYMAIHTGYRLMGALQRKARCRVIELGRFPGRVGVARAASMIELVVDMIGFCGSGKIILMAAIALFNRAFKTRGVTLAATHVLMCTGETERRGVMIERARLPAGHGVAADTGNVECAQTMIRLGGAVILFFMAAETGSIGALVAG